MSKSLFVNEAIIHYHDKECGQMRNNIQALQKRLFEAHQEIDQLKEEKRKWWWQRGKKRDEKETYGIFNCGMDE